MNEQTQRELGLRILRYGLVAVYLYFGIAQVLAPADWTGWLPAWSASIPLAPETLILMNGSVEIILGVALLAGIFTRIAAALLALHMLLITLDIGFTEIGVRDFGIVVGTAALALFGPDAWTIDSWRARK